MKDKPRGGKLASIARASAVLAVGIILASALMTGCNRPPRAANPPAPGAGTTPPQLDVQKPADSSFYPFTVNLAGTAAAGTYHGKVDPISSIEYRVVDTTIAGTAAPGADGSFSARFSTAGVRGDMNLTVAAVSRSGERTDRTIRLRDHAAGPYIGVDVPESGTRYDSDIRIAGWVRSSIDLRSTVDVASLEFRAVPLTYTAAAVSGAGNEKWRPVEYGVNGHFAFDVDASEFRGPVNLYFRATDRNGRVSSIVRRVIQQLSVAPVIVVDEPGNGSFYGKVINVIGHVELPGGIAQSADAVSVVRWTITSTQVAASTAALSGTAMVRGGRFSFAVPMTGAEGARDLIISASSGNLRSQVLVSLLYARPVPPQRTPETVTAASQSPKPTPPTRSAAVQAPAAVVPPKVAVTPEPKRDTATSGGPKPPEPPATEPAPIAAAPVAPLRVSPAPTATTQTAAKPQAAAAPTADIHPEITVTTPGPRSFYKTEIYVEGKITDNPKDPASVQNIRSFSYELEDRPAIKGVVNWDYVDGSFWFSFPSRGLSGTHTLVLTAIDAGGKKDIQRLTLYDGNTAPDVSIAGPGDQSTYGSRLWIHGRIFDPSEDLGQPRGITDATYYIYPSDFLSEFQGYRGKLKLGKDGSFSLLVLTGEFDGSEVIELSATSVNGNSTIQRVTVDTAKAEIPTFAVKSENSAAVLSWNRVPLASSYDIFYTDDGTEPGPRHGRMLSRVSAPVTISGLKNGYRYTFKISAHAPPVLPGDRVEPIPDSDGSRQEYQVIGKPVGDPAADTTLFSAPVIGIPLAPDTLQPTVRGEYGKIALSWVSIPGTDDFALLRSESETGPYLQIAHVTGAHSYLDSDVQYGRTYYYRVSPAYPGSIASLSISGATTPLPPSPFLLAGAADDTNARSVALVGNYAVVATGDEFSVVDVYDPHRPRVVGKVALTGARALAVDGTTVFAAAGSHGVKIVDVTDPTHPRLAGSWATGNAVAVAVVRDGSDRVVYIADGKGGLKMLSGTGDQSAGSVTTVNRDEADSLVVMTPTQDAGIATPFLCVGGQSGLAVYSLATINSPRRVFTDG
ncbi:MAG TPA: hypothetical protein VMW87_09060, partial [Spirochaetia bacterium]|nr:hypothetical protein [Spirochaetia bacterium]